MRQTAKPKSKAKRNAYTVVLPFPWQGGHWTTKGQELQLLPQEAKALLINGRIKPNATKTKSAPKSK